MRRNRILKTTSIFLFLLSSVLHNAVGQNSVFTCSIEPVFGIRNGTLSEYVYANASTNGKQYHLSLLDWDLQNSLYYGLNADAGIKNFHISVMWKSFIPSSRGYLQDSDWLQDQGYHTGRTDVKTNYSVHNNNLLSGLNLGVELRYDFNIGKIFTLSPFAEFTFENYSMKATDGTAWYGNELYTNQGNYYSYDDAANRQIRYFSGAVITLNRNDYYLWLGIQAKFKTPDKHWTFYADIAGSPFTYIYSMDNHLLTNDYIDIGTAVLYAVKGQTYVQFNFTKHAGIKLTVAGLWTGEIQGPDYMKEKTKSTYQKAGLSGSSSRYYDIQFSGVFSF